MSASPASSTVQKGPCPVAQDRLVTLGPRPSPPRHSRCRAAPGPFLRDRQPRWEAERENTQHPVMRPTGLGSSPGAGGGPHLFTR